MLWLCGESFHIKSTLIHCCKNKTQLCRGVNTSYRHCNTTQGSDGEWSLVFISCLEHPNMNTRGQEYLSGEVQVHRTTWQNDPALSFLRPQAASGAEQTAVGCIGLTWGMLPRLARHSFFGLFWSANGWREMMEERAVRWCQKVKRMSGSDDLKDL